MALVNGRSKLAKILAEKGRWRRSPVTSHQDSLAETGKLRTLRECTEINTTEQSSWAPTSHVLVVNCEATKATISATIKAIPVHRYPLSPFEL